MDLDNGRIRMEFLGHSGFSIDGERSIAIDPYNVSDNAEKADIILLTHQHYDHCSIKDIEKVAKPGSVVVAPPDCQSKITKLNDVDLHVIEIGDVLEIQGLKIEAVPAYNRSSGFHPKEEGWIGFVIKMGNVIIYHAGDTDHIPEMKRLSGYGKKGNEFIALLPVSGTYVMDPEEAAEAASILSADLTIPMHYGAGVAGTLEDAQKFIELCKDKGLQSEIMERL